MCGHTSPAFVFVSASIPCESTREQLTICTDLLKHHAERVFTWNHHFCWQTFLMTVMHSSDRLNLQMFGPLAPPLWFQSLRRYETIWKEDMSWCQMKSHNPYNRRVCVLVSVECVKWWATYLLIGCHGSAEVLLRSVTAQTLIVIPGARLLTEAARLSIGVDSSQSVVLLDRIQLLQKENCIQFTSRKQKHITYIDTHVRAQVNIDCVKRPGLVVTQAQAERDGSHVCFH